MRGWLTLLTRERKLHTYRTGVFLATAEPELVKTVLHRLGEEFPDVSFTLLGPRSYSELFAGKGTPVWLEDLKAAPLPSIAQLRNHKFDLAILILAGRPTFRKLKLAALFLNPRRFVMYNNKADSFVFDRLHGRAALSYLVRRSRYLHCGPILFVPFGFVYLACRTLLLRFQGRLQSDPPTSKI
jgi:hypothetical protein